MTRYAKAFAAAVATLVVFFVFGEGDVEEIETAIATIITTFTVYIVPNTNRGRP